MYHVDIFHPETCIRSRYSTACIRSRYSTAGMSSSAFVATGPLQFSSRLSQNHYQSTAPRHCAMEAWASPVVLSRWPPPLGEGGSYSAPRLLTPQSAGLSATRGSHRPSVYILHDFVQTTLLFWGSLLATVLVARGRSLQGDMFTD